ncbi:GMC oxidoreductase [Mycobacterium barrassiae]|uniref:GMC oxidoreductase n=1 Tax=Mycobacterium barrassiae TaxID=319709 RepID=UPI002265CBE2|nr:GMC oxidoreductase [Mycobacterium barrassiae]
MRTDVVVVGSGPIGAVVARRFAEAGKQVVLLEAGQPISSPPGSHVRNELRFQRDPDSYFAGIAGYFRYFDEGAPPEGLPGASTTAAAGGQGVLWTNNCPRPAAFELWPVMPVDEWDRYLGEAERYLDVHDDTFDDSVRQRCIVERLHGRLADDGRDIVGQPMAGRLVNASTIYYVAPHDILDGTSVPIRTARVICVRSGALTAPKRTQIAGVELADGEHIDADVVVVAAGAFDTPLLLYRSGLRSQGLGRYLTYHPVLVSQLVLDENLCRSDGYDIPARLQIPPTPTEPWNTMILRDTCPTPAQPPDLEVPTNRLVEIQSFCPVDIHPDNTMTIADDCSVRFHVPLRAADRRRMDAALADQHRLAAHLGRFRAGVEPQWMDLGFAHVMGTCRMGDVDDGNSVTDGFGLVWGTDNLYLATVGLIPTALAVNPTLTAAALAIRSADHALSQ